jgi:hypothetical protein
MKKCSIYNNSKKNDRKKITGVLSIKRNPKRTVGFGGSAPISFFALDKFLDGSVFLPSKRLSKASF